MGMGGVSATAEPFEAMVTGRDNKCAKSPKPATQENTTAHSQPGWSPYMQVQASYGAGPIPSPFFTSSVAASATPHPYMWGNQCPLMQPHAIPLQYPVLYNHRGIFSHPNGLALTISEAEGKISYVKGWNSMRKCNGSSENVEFVGGRLGENGKTASGSGNDNTSQSGSEDLSDESHDKAHQNEFSAIEKRSSNQMLPDGLNAQNNNTSHGCGVNHQVSDLGDLLLSMPTSKLNMGMSSNVFSAESKSMMGRLNASGVSQPVASAMMAGREEVMSEQLIQDERELKKERKRPYNEESARRLRIRRQQEYELLQAKVEELSSETSSLSYDLKRHSKYCMKLKRENKSLLEELKQTCGPDVISVLEAKNPDRIRQSTNGESNSYSPESPSEYDSSPGQSTDTSNSNWEVDAGSD